MIPTTINKRTLQFVVSYLGSLIAMAAAWYTTFWGLIWVFMASIIALLAVGLSLTFAKRTWLGMGFVAGCLSFFLLMPFLSNLLRAL